MLMTLQNFVSEFGFDLKEIGYAVLILFFGYILGRWANQFFIKILESSGIRQKLRFGIEKEARKYGFSVDIAYLAALALKYIIYLLTIFLALRVLNVQVGMNNILMPLIAYIPNILYAIITLVIGSAIVEIVSDIVKYKLRDAIDENAAEIGPLNISTPIASMLRYFLYSVIFITACLQLGIKVEGVLAFVLASSIVFLAAIAALVVLSLKDHAPSVSAGQYLRRSKTIEKGDWLSIGGVSGEVVDMTVLAMVVRNKDGEFCYIPNSKLTQEIFTVRRKRTS